MKQNLLSLLLLLLLPFAGWTQDPPQYGTPFNGVPDPQDVNMYQVHTRIFSTAGNLQGVISRLDQIKALGVNTIYLMPHYPIGTDSRSSGSPYCIKDFKGVGAEYGTLTDLRQLTDGAHARGMAVILDFIVNQTSFDHPWITQHPDWYQRDGSGNIVALFPDVAALNMNNTSMRAAMIDAMRYWIFAANVDGYRCDYANNAPTSFWSAVNSNLKGIPSRKILMMAEGDRPENFQAGFDLNFGDKFYYDALEDIANGASVSQIQTTTNTEYSLANSTQQVVRYTCNHDLMDDAPLLPLTMFKSHNGVVANFLVCAYMRGVPFLMSGQEVDFSTFVPYPWRSPKIDWNANPGAAADFTRVLNFRTSSNAVRRGTMTNYSNNDVCAFTKTVGTEKVVVMVNLRNATANYTIPSAFAGSYKDAYTGAAVTLTTGTVRSLAAFQYVVLTNAAVATVPVTGVSVSPTSASISAGLTRQLTAAVLPSNATNQTVTWSSSNTSVATVNSSGLVTAVAAGTATITATTQDGNRTATSAITVTAAPAFTVHFYRPSNWGTAIRIYWWAAQPAGVLANGSWPGISMTNEGNGYYAYTFYNITSTNLIFNDGTNQTADLTRNKTGWYLNGVWYDAFPGTPVAVTGVSVSPASATVNAGSTQQLTATVSPSNASNKNVSWSSSNTGVATVSSTGLVTAVGGGTASITVTTQDGAKTATCTITVPSSGGAYFTIRNRWKGTYLYDAGSNVGYGTAVANNNYKWEKVAVDATYFNLRNAGTGEYMHIENLTGSVQCTGITPSWWSAQWSQENVDGTHVRFRNRWQPGNIIHVEGQTGSAQYANAQDGWYSAQWGLESTTGARMATGVATKETPVEEKAQTPFGVHAFAAGSGRLRVQLTGVTVDENALLNVYNTQGQLVESRSRVANGVFDYNLRAGLYLVQFRSKEGVVVRRVAVQ